MTLDQLSRKTPAIITGFASGDSDLETRLREIGFAEGDNIEALHFGLFNKNPISVRLNGAIIALRRKDATAIKLIIRDIDENNAPSLQEGKD